MVRAVFLRLIPDFFVKPPVFSSRLTFREYLTKGISKMPLTISHPALSIPLKRFGLYTSALFIGAMMPDFEFFLSLSDGKAIGHTIPGIFIFCIPVGLIALFIFHKLIKFPLLSLVPHSHQVKLFPVAQRFRFFPFGNVLRIVLSLGIGAFSHIAWDSFTHHDGLMVQLFPFLSNPVLVLPQGTMRVYYILQYAGSFIGVLLMIYWYLKWYWQAEPLRHIIPHRFKISRKIAIGSSIGAFTFMGGLSYGFFTVPNPGTVEMLKVFITHTAIATMSSFMLALITFGILWHYFIPRHRRIKHVKKGMDLDITPAGNESA